jgi:AraC-like DNA-binding protein
VNPSQAYAQREFRRFIRAIGFKESSRDDREKVVALLLEMQKTARARGMSEDELATTYDAETLLDIYYETLLRRQ